MNSEPCPTAIAFIVASEFVKRTFNGEEELEWIDDIPWTDDDDDEIIVVINTLKMIAEILEKTAVDLLQHPQRLFTKEDFEFVLRRVTRPIDKKAKRRL